jgi:hypothetical protein
MRRNIVRLPILLCLLIAAAALPGRSFASTYPEETGNNTSSCDGSGSPGTHCRGAFTGMSSAASGTYNPAPGHVSPLPIRQYTYPGSTTRIYAAFMPWFTLKTRTGSYCHPSATSYPVLNSSWPNVAPQDKYLTCDGHIEVGYNSNDAVTVAAQMDDMERRGFDGLSIAWYGPPAGSCPASDHCVHDGTTRLVGTDLDGRCAGGSCPLNFLLRAQTDIWKSCADNDVGCIVSALNGALDNANANFFGHLSYLKDGGRPVVSFFDESSWPTNTDCTTTAPCRFADGSTCTSHSDCWTKIWAKVDSHTLAYSNGHPLFLFRNSSGFTHTKTAGAFAWPSFGSRSGCYSNDPNNAFSLCYLDSFYEASLNNLTLEAWGAAWKGFDDSAAEWSKTSGIRTIDQQCGRTWVRTLAEMHFTPPGGTSPYYYSNSTSERQLPFLLLATWNDYEEGTAIEMGIDNCYTVSAAVTGSTLSWSLQASDPDATEETIDHYEIFDSADGQTLSQVATAPRGARSVDLSGVPVGCGARTLYVKAVGAPSVLDKISGPVSYTSSANCANVSIASPSEGSSVASPFSLQVNESSARSTDSLLIYLDGEIIDRVFRSESASLSVPASPGSHTIQVRAFYSDGSSSFDSRYFTVASATAVTISSPVAGETYNSPIRVLANENTSRSATSMKLYLDGVGSNTLYNTDSYDVTVDTAPGVHSLTVKAWYTDGSLSSSNLSFTIREGSVAITSPASGATVSSPIHVVANESSSLAAISMKVYLDGTSVYSVTGSDTVDTSVPATSGPHTITVKAWYADGTVAERKVAVTVP